MTPEPDPLELALLAEANQRLVRTVDRLTDDELREPSLLPGWTRGHTVAHIALNGEGLERGLRGLIASSPATMYDSNESRNADIDELGDGDASQLRERLLGAVTCFERAVDAMTDWSGSFERTPGGPSLPAVRVPTMRLREVEIHHADLGTTYTHADWPGDFSRVVLTSTRSRWASTPFRVLARDLAETFEYGDGDPQMTVTGDAHDLAWWLTGRGAGETLTSDRGELPEMEAW